MPKGIIDPLVSVTNMEIEIGTAVAQGLGETNKEVAKILGYIYAETAKKQKLLARDIVQDPKTGRSFYRFGTLAVINESSNPPGNNQAQLLDINTLGNTPNGNVIKRMKKLPTGK